MLSIRQATIDDAQTIATLNMAVQQLHHQARPGDFKPPSDSADMVKHYQEILQSPNDRILIGEVDGQAVGYVYVRLFRFPENPFTYAVDAVYIDQMSVHHDHRGKGYGRQLVEAVIDLARREDISRVTLNVWLFNVEAIGFYEKLGFSAMSQAMELMVDG